MKLVLASASPARAQILTRAGLDFTTMVSEIDEDAVTAELAQQGHTEPAQIAGRLAQAKAEDVARRLADQIRHDDGPDHTDLLILGCDSVFEFQNQAYGKPWEPDIAVQRWREQSGKSGILHSGHWLIRLRREHEDSLAHPSHEGVGEVSSAVVSFAEVTNQEILDYVATGEPLPCAGGFTIEGRGAALIDRIEGDPNAVMGLSVSTLRRLMAHFTCSLTAAWANQPEKL